MNLEMGCKSESIVHVKRYALWFNNPNGVKDLIGEYSTQLEIAPFLEVHPMSIWGLGNGRIKNGYKLNRYILSPITRTPWSIR